MTNRRWQLKDQLNSLKALMVCTLVIFLTLVKLKQLKSQKILIEEGGIQTSDFLFQNLVTLVRTINNNNEQLSSDNGLLSVPNYPPVLSFTMANFIPLPQRQVEPV